MKGKCVKTSGNKIEMCKNGTLSSRDLSWSRHKFMGNVAAMN